MSKMSPPSIFLSLVGSRLSHSLSPSHGCDYLFRVDCPFVLGDCAIAFGKTTPELVLVQCITSVMYAR